MESSSTPSLVGLSVRSINDSKNPDFSDDRRASLTPVRSSSHLLNMIQSSTHEHHNKKDESNYTTVDELTREGALLTDDQDVDLDQLIGKQMDDIAGMKKALLRKKAQNKKVNSADSTPALTPMHSDSKSLVTSTDPIDDVISSPKKDDCIVENAEETIRNSFGEYIRNKSHRPHLARGDSYQTTKDEDSEATEVSGERQGRLKKKVSTEYLRSLSRSLNRDNKKHPSLTREDKRGDSRMYSTNNYSISQMDLEIAPHIIEEKLEEEEEEGVLMDDEESEEYPKELVDAAVDANARQDQ